MYNLSTAKDEARLGMIILYGVVVGREARLFQIMSCVYAVASIG